MTKASRRTKAGDRAVRRGSERGQARRIRVGVIFGGRSVEHEVSLVSARAIMAALDPARYDVVPIGISKRGRWMTEGTHYALPADPSVGGLIPLRNGGGRPARALTARPASGTRRASPVGPLDVVFPVVHGTGGEDGTLQGLLELADIPYVGAGVLGSALGMDKAAMKSAFRQAGLPIVDYRVVRRRDLEAGIDRLVAALEEGFDYPCFVKPSNGGSSVGVSKAKDRQGLVAGLRLAARYDRKILVERAVDAREIECSVLGNDDPEASVAGEIIPVNEFYDYSAKYIDPGSRLVIPAELDEERARRVQEIAVRAFQALDLAGMARVDFFIDRATEAIFLNEVNTIPGFTSISMYPKLWEASGVAFPELVDRLVRLAFERHAEKKTLATSYDPSAGRRGKGR
ncbi:MAG TPA: D-alanine--D-alanine ligase family protein [Candidatus Polarisedimenticolia bacterium]|nr:D-alanine--D-alanine ligase family protein [Candidatus Polarisedimenticolia bacterium]